MRRTMMTMEMSFEPSPERERLRRSGRNAEKDIPRKDIYMYNVHVHVCTFVHVHVTVYMYIYMYVHVRALKVHLIS